MTRIPFVGQPYRYRGRDLTKQRRTAEKNHLVQRIAKHANTLVANDPSELQTLFFASIALDLSCDVEIVRHALSDGGYNGITFRVTLEDRIALEEFKTDGK